MKIKSFKSLGIKEVWNLTVDHKDHNYLLSNGLISKNSHAYSYSLVTYATAWLKAHYPLEFYCGFLTVKSAELSPDDFQFKLKEVVAEAKTFNIEIKAPDINSSDVGFNPNRSDSTIYFGLSGIKDLGVGSIKEIIKARPPNGFTDIYDFLERVNRSKVNTGKLEALVKSGCFDKLGYQRTELVNSIQSLYDYYSDLNAYNQRLIDAKLRDEQRADAIANSTKKMPALKLMEIPVKPLIGRYAKLTITYSELQEQAAYTGVFLGLHPVKMVKGNFTSLSNVDEGGEFFVRGIVVGLKEITTKKGDKMAFLKLEDDTTTLEVTVFPETWKHLRELKLNSLVKSKINYNKKSWIVKTIEIVG